MRCNSCNSEVEEHWNFCASCGANVINEPDRLAQEISASILASLNAYSGSTKYAIKTRPRTSEAALRKYSKKQKQTEFLQTPYDSRKVVEPKMEITRLPGKLVLLTELPEVASGNHIKIMLLRESLEIRAVSSKKMYMKIIPLPRRMRFAGSSFVDGKLKVELGEIARQ